MSINVGSHIGEGAESIGRLPSSRRLKNITPEGILSQEVMRVTGGVNEEIFSGILEEGRRNFEESRDPEKEEAFLSLTKSEKFRDTTVAFMMSNPEFTAEFFDSMNLGDLTSKDIVGNEYVIRELVASFQNAGKNYDFKSGSLNNFDILFGSLVNNPEACRVIEGDNGIRLRNQAISFELRPMFQSSEKRIEQREERAASRSQAIQHMEKIREKTNLDDDSFLAYLNS